MRLLRLPLPSTSQTDSRPARMYPLFFRFFLSRLDAERAHHLAVTVIQAIPRLRMVGVVRRLTRPHPSLATTALGLRFDSPFGVAAGFDKNATMVRGLWSLGFSHIEIGTVTAIAQPGNEKPRLFRLIPDRAVVNRMGFNNEGAASVATRLIAERMPARRPVIGVNIGKSRVVGVDSAVDDYLDSARLLAPLADYLAVNVSSPNTPGLRGLQEIEKLAPLLGAVRDAAETTPVLVKIAPDLSDDEVRRISLLVVDLGLAGIIATNTTLARTSLRTPAAEIERAGAGGLSGGPLRRRALEVLKVIRSVVPPEICVISVGGVDTAADVRERLAHGATLVQGYTAFLYRGPLWARQINRGLAAR